MRSTTGSLGLRVLLVGVAVVPSLMKVAQAQDAPPETPTFPVRFESSWQGHQFVVTGRPWDEIDDQPLEDGHVDRFGAAPPRCITPCTLNLPEGRIRVTAKDASGRQPALNQSLRVPPRPSVATIRGIPRLMWGALATSIVGVLLVVAATPLDFVAGSCFRSGPGDNCNAFGLDVAVTGAGVVLAVAAGVMAGVAARGDVIQLRDDHGHAAAPRLRFTSLGGGPTQSAGLTVGFSF